MRNKRFILFSLCLAFSIVLGHSIVPHHHHDNEKEWLAQHGEQDDLGEFFSHFAHNANSTTGTYHFTGQQHLTTLAKEKQASPVTAAPLIAVSAANIPADLSFPDLPDKLTSLNFPGPRSPRAPPLC